MVLSKNEQRVLRVLDGIEGGYMPVNWFKPAFRGSVARLRELGLLYKRDPDTARLTRLGKSTAQSLQQDKTT
jgi:hypothetical protein